MHTHRQVNNAIKHGYGLREKEIERNGMTAWDGGIFLSTEEQEAQEQYLNPALKERVLDMSLFE